MENNNPGNKENLSKNLFVTNIAFWAGRDSYIEMQTNNINRSKFEIF